jgi:hypothetical protein
VNTLRGTPNCWLPAVGRLDNQFVRVRAKGAHANESIYLRSATWLLAKLDDHITTEPLT